MYPVDGYLYKYHLYNHPNHYQLTYTLYTILNIEPIITLVPNKWQNIVKRIMIRITINIHHIISDSNIAYFRNIAGMRSPNNGIINSALLYKG